LSQAAERAHFPPIFISEQSMSLATNSSAARAPLSALADVLRVVKRRVEDMTFRERVETHLYCGRPLRVIIADRMAAEWYGSGCARMKELGLLAGRGLNPGGRIFDIGAHQGVVAMMLAGEVGPKGKVIAVEATERNATIARRNAAMNDMPVEILHAAVARVDGPILFSQKRNGSVALGRSPGVASVDGYCIDTLSARYGFPDLVYLDIEGYELEALKGAKKTLASRASWCIEVHGDVDLGRFGACNADVSEMFDDSFDLFWSPDNATVDFTPLPHGVTPTHERYFLAAIKKA
jgi:FkbM family methyltransferase